MDNERTMRAAFYTSQGPARDVLETGRLSLGHLSRGEVRVRLVASGVNPTDIYARSGSRGGAMEYDRIVPHHDGAGTVEAVGPNVHRSWIGQRVWVYMARWKRATGTAAEYLDVPVQRVARLPDDYPFEIGACLGIPWMTAYEAVASLGTVAGRDVLVSGGSGAVSIYAIQIAVQAGANVIAAISREEAGPLARSAGASAIVDLRQVDVGEQLRQASTGGRVDRLIESRFSSNASRYGAILGDRARVVVYGTGEPTAVVDVSAAIRSRTSFRFIYAFSMSRGAQRRAITRFEELAGNGRLIHLPVSTYPLEAIAAAHEAVELGNRGRRVVIGIRSGP